MPASRMIIWPSARISTQEVLPPYWTVVGPGVGIGLIGMGALQALGRNPGARAQLMTVMILSIAFAESVAIYALVVAILLIFVI